VNARSSWPLSTVLIFAKYENHSWRFLRLAFGGGGRQVELYARFIGEIIVNNNK